MVPTSRSRTDKKTNSNPPLRSSPGAALLIIITGSLLLLLGIGLSITVGAADIRLATVWDAVFHFQPDLQQHQVIRELRMPRGLTAALVGAGFAVSGALMQGMTRNPLADSGLLGLNAGAGLGLALIFAFWPQLPFTATMLFSFLGAAASAVLVFGIGAASGGGLTPIRLTLAGAAVGSMLLALSQGVAIYFNLSQELAFWYAGGVAGVTWTQLYAILPWLLGGLVLSVMISRQITVLSLGSEVASGLGQRTVLIQIFGMLIVLMLAGAAVSAVGPVAFVGLMVPHIARYLVGVDYRWIIPCSAVLGGLMMLFADIGSRIVNPPYETPLGALIAVIGVPFFVVLARRERGNRS